jgi:hypothetical protein
MEDVIFNGSETQPPVSMAEVSLTFEIGAGDQLAPQYAGLAAITVTRRLFRSGESEYLINRTHCRLLDIVELFLGTGVGRSAYSIIEQGRVGLIVSSKPEDRRAFIEEAAGVTKYKSAGAPAERKMEATEANLLRVADLVGELEKRLDSLGRQARKAEKYRTLKAKAREIELHQASHRLLGLLAEQKSLREELASLGENEQAAVARVRSLEDDIEARRRALESEGARLQALADEVHALDSQTRSTEQNLDSGGRISPRPRAGRGRRRPPRLEGAVRVGWARSTPAPRALEAELAALGVPLRGRRAALPSPGGARRRAGRSGRPRAGWRRSGWHCSGSPVASPARRRSWPASPHGGTTFENATAGQRRSWARCAARKRHWTGSGARSTGECRRAVSSPWSSPSAGARRRRRCIASGRSSPRARWRSSRCARSWPTAGAAWPRWRRSSATTRASTAGCAR